MACQQLKTILKRHVSKGYRGARNPKLSFKTLATVLCGITNKKRNNISRFIRQQKISIRPDVITNSANRNTNSSPVV